MSKETHPILTVLYLPTPEPTKATGHQAVLDPPSIEGSSFERKKWSQIKANASV
jgi:hypothetical protein